MSRADMDLHLSDASARFPELVTVRRSRAAAIAKALAMVAVIATAIAVTIVVRSIGGDRDGWKATAEAAGFKKYK